MLMPLAADDAAAQARNAAFLQGLQQLGWTVGQNVQIEYRWSGGNDELTRRYGAELAAVAPEVILATGSASMAPLLQATRTVPIVFAIVPDPVGAGFVDSLARPGGNATGFTSFDYGIGAKWVETAQGDRTARDARGGASRSRHRGRDRRMGRDPDSRAVTRLGGKSGQHA
jgi:putative ABC transport system substrate-binding protein